MYVPKKLKWETLGAFKKHLETETNEKVLVYNGYELFTETTHYGIVEGQLNCRPASPDSMTEAPRQSRHRGKEELEAAIDRAMGMSAKMASPSPTRKKRSGGDGEDGSGTKSRTKAPMKKIKAKTKKSK